MTELLESLLRGLGTGSIYALLALGFVIIYKSTEVISFAQPALMLARRGASVSYLAPALASVRSRASRFFVSLPWLHSPPPCSALVIERLVIRPMVGRPVFVVAIITIGIDIAVRVVANGFIGLDARAVANPWGLKRIELVGLRCSSGTW